MKTRSSEQGSALMLTVILVFVIVGISGAMLSETLFRGTQQHASMTSDEAQLICDAALERVRRALLEYRNNDPSAWNEILIYNMSQELAAGGSSQGILGSQLITNPNTGQQEETRTLALRWQLTNTDAIKKTYVNTDLSSYNQVTSVNTDIPSNFEDLFCKIVPYGRGAYHIVMSDNEDLNGDGIDETTSSIDPSSGQLVTVPKNGDLWDVDGDDVGVSTLLVDGDRQAFLVITAILPDGTMRQNVAFVKFPSAVYAPGAAIETDGDIQMGGAFSILGTQGSVVANGNITGNGGGQAQVSGAVNAAGSAAGFSMNNTPPGGINSGVSPVPMPTLDIPFYKSQDFALKDNVIILKANGTITNVNGGPAVGVFPFSATIGANGVTTWKISGSNSIPTPAIYYVEGDFKMTGQGNSAGYTMSIIAEGNISLAGNSAFKPFEVNGESTGTLALAGKDIKLAGTGSALQYQYEGVMIASEQIVAQGTYDVNGSLVGLNLTDSPGSLISNQSGIGPDLVVQGTPTITYNGIATFVPPPATRVSVESIRRTK